MKGAARTAVSAAAANACRTKRVRSVVGAGHVMLVETLAERLAEACLVDERVELVRIRVEKLDVFDDLASVGVEIERRRGTCPREAIDSQ